MAGAGGSERVRPPRGEALRARRDRLGPPLKAAAAAGSPGPVRPWEQPSRVPLSAAGQRDERGTPARLLPEQRHKWQL